MLVNDQPLIDAFVETYPDGLSVEGGRGTCIETSKVAVAVLGRLGVACKAVAADVGAFNASAWLAYQAGVPFEEWPKGAYSVGVGCGIQEIDETSLASAQEPHRTSGFVGHVVVVGDDWLLDMTAPQLHRPDHGIIVVGPVLVGPVPGIGGKDPYSVDLAVAGSMTRISYVTRPEIKRYRTSPAWRNDTGFREAVDTLVERTREHMEGANVGDPG